MKSDGGWIQGYNGQAAVDGDHQVIVAIGVSNQPPDVEHLEPMLERIAANAGDLPEVMTLDAGYWSEANAQACSAKGVDAYNRSAEAFGYATGRQKHGQPPPPRRGPIPRNLDMKGRMARKLQNKTGREIYAPLCQESCRLSIPTTFSTRGLDGIDQCVLTARPLRLMSAGG